MSTATTLRNEVATIALADPTVKQAFEANDRQHFIESKAVADAITSAFTQYVTELAETAPLIDKIMSDDDLMQLFYSMATKELQAA